MSGTIGRGLVLTVGGVEVQNIKSVDMSTSLDLADATTNDSAGYKENVYADMQISLDVTCNYAEATGLEDVLEEAFTNRAGVAVDYDPIGGDNYEFNAKISSLSISASTGDVVEISFSLESSGTITYPGT